MGDSTAIDPMEYISRDPLMAQYEYLRSVSANEVLVDHVEPSWMGRRLYYLIRQDAYYAYDHRWGFRYFGRYPNDEDAKARWRGWLRSGEAL